MVASRRSSSRQEEARHSVGVVSRELVAGASRRVGGREEFVVAPRVSCHEHRIKAHRLHVKRQLFTRGVKGDYSASRQFVIVSSLLQSSCEQSRSSSHGLSPLENQCVLPLESRRRTKGLLVVVSSHQMVIGVCRSIKESSSPRSDTSLLLVRRCEPSQKGSSSH